MPSGRTHAALTRAILKTTDGRVVQQLMDRTASEHGPSHRHDSAHSLPDLAIQLALRGKLTPDNMAAGVLHLAQDKFFDAAGRIAPAGTPRRVAKLIMEDAIQRTFRRKR